jgi:hypothetical protein
MFNPKYRRYIQSFLLVWPMTGLVCAINTMVAKGAGSILTMGTLKRWGISLAVAFPVVLFMAPLAANITNRLIKNNSGRGDRT